MPAKAINAPPRTSSCDGPIPRDRRRSRARSRRRPAGLDAAHVGFVFTDVHQGCQYGNGGLRYVCDFVQPSGRRNTRHNSGSKNEYGGPARLPGVVGPRTKRRPPAPNDPIGKLALASVAHRPGPGRSEQVRKLGPGPYFQFGRPASAKNTTAARAKRIATILTGHPLERGRRRLSHQFANVQNLFAFHDVGQQNIHEWMLAVERRTALAL